MTDPGQPDGSIELAITGAVPAGLTISVANNGGNVEVTIGTVEGMESGKYLVDIIATDLFGGTDTETLNIIVPGGLTSVLHWELME